MNPIYHAGDNQYINLESLAKAPLVCKYSMRMLPIIAISLDAEAVGRQLIVAISKWLGGQRWTLPHWLGRLTFPSFAGE